MQLFFSMGEKVTGGDPIKKASFEYGLMWIMFIGFVTLLARNIFYMIITKSFNYIGWSLVLLAIVWFQYNGLGSFYHRRKKIIELYKNKTPKVKEDSIDEMMSEFKKKEVKNDRRI